MTLLDQANTAIVRNDLIDSIKKAVIVHYGPEVDLEMAEDHLREMTTNELWAGAAEVGAL